MALRKKPVLGGIILVIIFGITVVYLRLWTIDSSFSSEDRESLRKEFDRANMEALDESAHWRMRYDGELERVKQYLKELLELKEALTSANHRLAALQRENTVLNKQVETLRGEVETKKMNWNSSHQI